MNKKIKNLIFFSLSLLMIFELAFSNLSVVQAAPTFNESPVVLSGNGITFNGTPNRKIDWTSYDGYSLTAGVATSAGNADTVDSKHIGTTTAGKWCTTDGTNITCTSNSPLMSFTELDPLVSAWAKAAAKPAYTFNEIGSGSISATTGNFSSTVNGTGLCIAGDCKVSWPAIIAAGGGNLWSGTTTGAIYSANSGNVGIGVTNPTHKLDVWDVVGFRTNGGSYDTHLFTTQAAGVAKYMQYDASGNIKNVINAGGDNYITGGNVGIGTTNPNMGKLQVVGTASGSDFVAGFLKNTITSTNSTVSLMLSGDDVTGRSVWRYNTNSGKTIFGSSAGNNYDLGFVSGGAEAITIKYGGNVGIGTTAPVVDANVSRFLTLDGGASNYGEFSVGMNQTGTTASVGGVNFFNSALGVAEKRVATIWAGTDGATNSGNIQFYTFNAGTVGERMRITSGGNIGISKTNPGATLDVVGSGTFTGTVNGTGLCIGGDCKTSWAAVGSGSAGWNINGNEVYKSATAGNVGIGTTNPGVKLDVTGALRATSATIVGGDITLDSYKMINFGSFGHITTEATSPNEGLALYGDGRAGGWYGYIDFYTSYNGGAAANAMRIINGNVGIGTTNPLAKLDISGSSLFGQANANDQAPNTSTFRGYSLYYDVNHRYGNYANILLGADSAWTTGARRFMITNGMDATSFAIIQSVDSTTDPALGAAGAVTSGTARFTILNTGNMQMNGSLAITGGLTTTGNVGIAKTNPAVALDVVGSGSFTGTVNGTGLCIGGDCKVSWPAIIAAGGGNLWSGTTTGAVYSANSGNVGIGQTAPGAKLDIVGTFEATSNSSSIFLDANGNILIGI